MLRSSSDPCAAPSIHKQMSESLPPLKRFLDSPPIQRQYSHSVTGGVQSTLKRSQLSAALDTARHHVCVGEHSEALSLANTVDETIRSYISNEKHLACADESGVHPARASLSLIQDSRLPLEDLGILAKTLLQKGIIQQVRVT